MRLTPRLLPPHGNGTTVIVHDNTCRATYAHMGGGVLTGMCALRAWRLARYPPQLGGAVVVDGLEESPRGVRLIDGNDSAGCWGKMWERVHVIAPLSDSS